jgi:3-hydroxyisobutyrate dehydrogenase
MRCSSATSADRALSSLPFRISERIGDGARTKLVNNLLAGINLAAAAR